MPSTHQYYYASKPGAVMNEHQASRGTTWVTALLVDLLEELLSEQYNIYIWDYRTDYPYWVRFVNPTICVPLVSA